MKIHKYLLVILLFTSCNTQLGLAQNEGGKKAQEAYKKADEHLVFGRYQLAMEGFEKAVSIDPNFIDARLQLANIYQNLYLDYENAAVQYEAIISADSNLTKTYYEIGRCFLYLKDWEKAQFYAKKYEDKRKPSSYTDWLSSVLLGSIELSKNAVANPVNFNPQNLGPAVNSEQAEYFPSITADNEFVYFTVNNKQGRYPNEDIYSAQFLDGEWKAREAVKGVNKQNTQEGAHSITQDGRYLFFASDRMEDNYGRFDIYIAKKVGEEWRAPVNMGRAINSRNWESQPVISADSKQLFLVRKSDDGYGGSDIYVSTIDGNGQFGELQNLSGVINTPGDEQRPYLHPDGKTLYFASNGHPGLGKTDVYKSSLKENGEWSVPVNLGYPINSSEVEFGLYVAADGKTAYFSSNREGGFGDMDIYSFELPRSAQPAVVISVKGLVRDRISKEYLRANIKISELESGAVYKTLSSDVVNGSFLVTLPAGYNYSYAANVEGYLPYSASFSLEDSLEGKVLELIAEMTRIGVGQEFILKNIFFSSGQAVLKESSKVELAVLLDYLQENNSLKLEVGGHTDSDGTEEYNLILSEQRAKAVFDYLLKQGVSSSRLTYKGYGESQAIVPNDSEENKGINRRTAFKVI